MQMNFFKTVVLVFFCACTFNSRAQTDTLPYLKDKNMPALVLLNMDSTSFNTYNISQGKKTVLFYFSPDCDHCQILAKEIIADQEALKKAVVYFISPMELSVVREFDKKYEISKQKNMHIYKDAQHLFPADYGVRYFPFLVVYDEHKQLLKAFDGGMKMEALNALVQ
jgi:thioredoxin-related protein